MAIRVNSADPDLEELTLIKEAKDNKPWHDFKWLEHDQVDAGVLGKFGGSHGEWKNCHHEVHPSTGVRNAWDTGLRENSGWQISTYTPYVQKDIQTCRVCMGHF